MTVVIRTDDEPIATRMDYWRNAICDTFVPLDMGIDRPEEYQGRVVYSDLGATQVTEISTSLTVVRRTPRLIRRSDPGIYKLELLMHGTNVFAQGGREALLNRGDFAIADQTRPYELAAGYSPHSGVCSGGGLAQRMLTFTFPHALLPVPVDDMVQLTAVRMSRQAPVTGLVAPILHQLARCAADDDSATATRLSSVLLDVLAVGLARRLDRPSGIPPESHRRTLLVHIHAFIERHLDRLDLSPGTIAAAHHISLRYLHKLFEPEGTTVAERIRLRRLERCRRDLADPAHRSRSVAAIAARWGVRSPEHFGRLFRATYGLPPGEYRRIHCG